MNADEIKEQEKTYTYVGTWLSNSIVKEIERIDSDAHRFLRQAVLEKIRRDQSDSKSKG